MTKAKYKIKNWSLYNKSLIARGSINLWIDDKIKESWFYCSNGVVSVGSPSIYSDSAIELCLTVRAIYQGLRITHPAL